MCAAVYRLRHLVNATEVTAGRQKATADYCWVNGVIHFTSPAGWLPVHRDQLRAQRSVTSMGKLYLTFTFYSRTNTAELIEMQSGKQAIVGLKNRVVEEGLSHPREGALLSQVKSSSL